ncbi:MAG: site-specific DNA-methyltransferase [Thermodesulfovibrionales bacterium]|nr:site-specific DNA-methyltransferase [Thermodesulfovibrionales bacterium]
MYKKIILTYDTRLDDKDYFAVKLFNEKFTDDEIRLEPDTDKIVILLREVDILKLKELSYSLSSYTEKSIFYDLIQSVEKIKSYGIKGNKRNYVDYNKERKVKDRQQKEVSRRQYYYAQGHAFKTNNNNTPDEFKNKIIVGDSELVLKNIPDNCIDLILTSPPYNFGLEYEANEDAHFWETYFGKLFRIFEECIRILKYGGRIAVNIQPLFSDYIPSHHIISNFFISKKLIWKGEILWEKNNYNCKYTAWGSWKSPSNPYLKYTWEFIELFCKGDLKKTGSSEHIDISPDEFKKWVVAKWSIAPERNMKEYGHPAMFPEELVERVIKLFSYKHDIVLDPFNGVGTTTTVAKKLKRYYCGIDISEEYCKTAQRRIEELRKSKDKVLLNMFHFQRLNN